MDNTNQKQENPINLRGKDFIPICGWHKYEGRNKDTDIYSTSYFARTLILGTYNIFATPLTALILSAGLEKILQ